MNKEKPILFSGPMVRAILDGRKTMTRRSINPQPIELDEPWPNSKSHPFIKGQRLWVKEAHRLTICECTETCRTKDHVWYEADQSGYHNVCYQKLRPAIFMPRWASRLTLEIKSVRAERLQDISLEDAYAEGVGHLPGCSHIDLFRELWDRLNLDKYPWASNPWVWAISFFPL